MSDQETKQFEPNPGNGPKYEVADLPEPARNLTPRLLFVILGPAVIALGNAIGAGEWLIGPTLFVKYGLALLWITTISATLQLMVNLEMCRYTLYTGEPITVGFMRLQPGKMFWGGFFTIFGFIERGLPGWSLATAVSIVAFQMGVIPGAGDRLTVVMWGYLVFVSCAILLIFGKSAERTLEWANWFMMAVTLVGLIILDIYIVPAGVWLDGLKGFVSFGYIPHGVDTLLLGALVGYSAMGGYGNTCISNWYRDKGWGMGERMGYIPAMLGGKEVHVATSGKFALPTLENISRWKGWWKLLNIDQIVIFYIGSMLGMFLPGILNVAVMPVGQTLQSWGVATQASGLIQQLGYFGFLLALLFGFLILYSTAVTSVDIVVRQTTDMLWFASERVRKVTRNDIRKVYYMLLAIFIVWGISYVNLQLPLVLLAVGANIANLNLAVAAILTLRLNRKVLPKEFRGSLIREILLVCTFLFFGFFFAAFVIYRFWS